jgi:ribosome-binding protein aMBF1 (putative translation factor)
MSQSRSNSPQPKRPTSRTVGRVAASGPSPKPESGTPLISAFLDEDGHVAVQRVAESFGMSKGQLAETVGLGRETLHKAARSNATKAQSRILEMLEIVGRVSAWAGGKEQGMAWYRAQPIAAFGDRTAEALVKSGQAAAVRDYLDHLALGGFA